MLNIVIGYDQREAVAYHVLAHSIMSRASEPICIIPLRLDQLERRGIYWRERDPDQTTDFTFSRFLTPYLTHGDAAPCIFMDCDMLCLTDICEVVDLTPWDCDVAVVKHSYTPNPGDKFLGQKQTIYPCKNWSSFMVFNQHRSAVKGLDLDYINKASAMDLHQFNWCRNPLTDVAGLPIEWNHLVGEYEPNPNAKIVHFTRGGPWFPDYAGCEFADEWRAELKATTSCDKIG